MCKIKFSTILDLLYEKIMILYLKKCFVSVYVQKPVEHPL